MSKTKDLHRFEVDELPFREESRHVIDPRKSSSRAMSQQRLCIETGLILDQKLELLVFDRLR